VVEVTALARMDLKPPKWWAPDGSPIAPVLRRPLGNLSAGPYGQPVLMLLHTVRDPSGDSTLTTRFSNQSVHAEQIGNVGIPVPGVGTTMYDEYAVTVPPGTKKVDVEIGVASGPWKEEANLPLPTSQGAPATRSAGGPSVGQVTEENGKTKVELLGFAGVIDRISEDHEDSVDLLTKDGRRVGAERWEPTAERHVRDVITFPVKRSDAVALTIRSRVFEYRRLADVCVTPAGPRTNPHATTITAATAATAATAPAGGPATTRP
jgi:hypothetical protein